MAKYRNLGPQPGAYVVGYPFFISGEEMEFGPEVKPNWAWVPLDDAAFKAMRNAGFDVKEVGDSSHVVAISGEIVKKLEQQRKEADDTLTMSQLAGAGGRAVAVGMEKLDAGIKRASDKKI